QPLVSGATLLTTFGQDSSGELYTAAGNTIYKLVGTTPAVPALPRASHAPLLLALAFLSLGAGLAARLRRRGPSPYPSPRVAGRGDLISFSRCADFLLPRPAKRGEGT